MKTKYLDLTNNEWKRNYLIGLRLNKLKLPKIQSRMNKIAAVNFIIPGTLGPITSPIIMWIGRRLSIKEKVKLR